MQKPYEGNQYPFSTTTTTTTTTTTNNNNNNNNNNNKTKHMQGHMTASLGAEEDNRKVLRHNRDQCKVHRFQIQQYFNNAILPTVSFFFWGGGGHISLYEMWDIGLLLGRICYKL